MYFALSADDLMFYVFPTVTALTDYCEGCDVESGGWLFWDQSGAPLQPRFTELVYRSGRVVSGGIYVLEAGAGERLLATLHRITAVESDASFRSVEDVRKYLGG